MERIGVWVNAVTSIGVIVGLAMLAIELNQNSQVMRYQSGRDSTTTAVGINLASMEPAIAEVLAKGYRNETALSTAELLILDSYVVAWMMLFQQDFLEYREGLQPEEWWLVREQSIRTILSSDWSRKVWTNYSKESYNPEFMGTVAAILKGVPTRDYYESIETSKP